MNKVHQQQSIFWLTLMVILLSASLSRAAGDHTPVSADKLGGTVRYLAYLSSDKPVYREGESVYLRTVILNARDNTPIQTSRNTVQIEIFGPNGDLVHQGYSSDNESVIGYAWSIPAGTAGGEYKAKVTSPTLGFSMTERNFDVRAYRAPRMKTQIEFTRDGYGPGDEVKAGMTIERAEGGIPEGANVTVVARVDGVEVYRSVAAKISDSGLVETGFTLPGEISVGEGSLSFIVEDGGVVETAAISLPIVLQKLNMTFYPESGELVAGLSSRVYFQALLPNGKPADVAGFIAEIENQTEATDPVAEFSSVHEGRGLFEFTPEKGKQYVAIFTAPSGINTAVELPAIAAAGTVLKSSSPIYKYADDIQFSYASSSPDAGAVVTLHKREQLIDRRDIRTGDVVLDAKDAEGVLIATAWDRDGRPLAERLIYRQPRFSLNVELKLSDKPYVPGGQVSVDILTTDSNGNPVEAIVGLTVTDDTVLELIDKREQAPRLPVMVYLENEVEDLADAHVYLDNNDPLAPVATDLLLGTQGWRKFVLVDYDNIKQQSPSQAARILAHKTIIRPQLLVQRRGVMAMAAMPEAEMALAAVPEAVIDDVAAEAIEELQQVEPLNDNKALLKPAEKRVPAAPHERDAQLADARMDKAENAMPAGAMVADRNRLVGIAAPQPFIREYAYQVRPDRQPDDRIDFTETLYWNSGVKTSARDGRATVSFGLSDSVTTFRLLADAFGRNGALGTGDHVFASVEPFFITTKMPLHAIAGDTIELPVTLVNSSNTALNNARLKVTGTGIEALDIETRRLAAGERLRTIIKVVTTKTGEFPITVNAMAGTFSDTVTRQLTVSPAGFPVSINESGLLSSDSEYTTTIRLPAEITAGSITANAMVYPSPLASMEEALNALLREPHGCFEQTSSSNYPLVMAQQYFDTHTGIDPAKISRARELLEAGYKKLVSFESQDNGYEWFGANPAHEALTAYGLMEFSDMAKVMRVDEDMIGRTRQWLLDRRDGNGGFKRNERALDSFGRAPAPTTNAYIVWSLLESGQSAQSLKIEIEHIKSQALKGNDSYIDALAANILYLAGDSGSAAVLAKKLITSTDNTGVVAGSVASITNSGGDALLIETTSLALLAWLRDDQWAGQVEKSIQWLFERSKAGRFGSTQSTVLALKAINAYDAARAVPKHPGSVQLFIDGNAFGQPVAFNTDTKGAISLPDFSVAISSGEHQIEMRMLDGSKMPFSLSVTYNTPKPANADNTPIKVATRLSHQTIKEGEPLELMATVTVGGSNAPTPIAIIGLPAGLELRHDQLKELVGSGSISAYEIRQSELILYWRALEANEQLNIPVSLTAAVPGSYTAPASRIYPYYTDEQKYWQRGESVVVTAR